MVELVQGGPAKGTWRNLKTHSKRYHEFCTVLKVDPFPLTEIQMCRFVAYLTFSLGSYGSVVNYLGGIRKLNALARLQPPICTGYIDNVLKGVKRLLAHPIKQADPMTPALLLAISKFVDTNDQKQVCIFTAMVVGFFLFLRAANLTCKTQFDSFDPEQHLSRGDFRCSDELILVKVTFTKTIQFKERVILMPLLPVRNKAICPIHWLRLMLRGTPASSDSPAFCFRVGDRLAALTYQQLSDQMKKWASTAGVKNVSRITPYSLRRGGCTWAFESNLPATAIRILGDWASDTFYRYIACNLQHRLGAMVTLVDNCQSV